MNPVLQEKEEYYRLLIEHSRDLICELSHEGEMKGRYLYLSPNYPQVLGYQPEELLYADAFALVHPDDLAEVAAKFGGPSDTATFRYRHKNGSWVWLECSGQVFKNAAGEERSVIVSRDVTESKKNLERLRESEATLNAAQRMIHAGSWEMDFVDPANLNNNPLRWSDEVYRIFGYEPGDLDITPGLFFDAVYPDDREMIREAVKSA